MNFTIDQLYPFLWRKNIIKPRWYEKITARYVVKVVNQLDFYDSSFVFSQLRWNDFRNGVQHTASLNSNYNLLKYINTSVTATYYEYWNTQKTFKQYNFTENKVDTFFNQGFFTSRDFNINSSFSTRIYGTRLYKKGWLRGIRHVITPSIHVAYRPDFSGNRFNYYYSSIMDNSYTPRRVSYFDGSIIGGPPAGPLGGIGFDLGNNLQLKVASGRDSTREVKKINLIDGLNINVFYNAILDSFKWSNPTLNYRTTLFENIQINGNLNWTLYQLDTATGRLTKQMSIYEKGKLARLQGGSVSMRASLPLKKKTNAMDQATPEQRAAIGNQYRAYADFNIPWSLNINYNLALRRNYLVAKKRDTLVVTQDVNFGGDVNLTPKWKIAIVSGYNVNDKKLSFTSIDIYRDLHCWEMRLNLIPFGFLRSYNFSLNVKSSVLQDLKLVRRRDFRDNF
jgi:hypothetical protein